MADQNDSANTQLMEKVRQGEEQAFEKLFKEHYFNLSRFAWRYVNSKAVAEELVQEVFADIWEQRKTWDPSGSVQAYLYQAVKHRAIDHIRHNKIRREQDPQWMANKQNPTIDFTDSRREKQVRTAIKKAIEALPARSKMTFKLHRYDGLTYQEIAEVMEVSVKTVESQMTRTLKKLRSRLSFLLPLLSAALLFL